MSEPFDTRVGRIQRTNPLTSILSDVGKLQPQAVDVEEAVLGALMLEKDAYLVIMGLLKPESFYKDEHKEIYEAIHQLYVASQPVDLLTVTNKLRQLGKLEFAGGAFYISELTNRVSSAANIEYHARIIAEKSILRQLIYLTTDLQRDAYDETSDVFELLDKAGVAFNEIIDLKGNRSVHQIYELIQSVHTDLKEKKANKEQSLAGILTGFVKLDDMLGGLHGGDFIIVAARPGMGKTSFLLDIAKYVAKKMLKRVAVFSLEMTGQQLAIRAFAPRVGISVTDVRRGLVSELQMEFIMEACIEMESWGIYVDDTPGLNILEFRAALRKMIMELGIDFAVVDYLQLMEGPESNKKFGSNREQEISAISRGIKKTAKEHNIPVMALSQLSRQVEQRGGQKRPNLADLRESGSLEQDADQVIFIHRPEYYGLTEGDNGLILPEGFTEIIVAKNRHGETGSVPLIFKKKEMQFTDDIPDQDRHLISAIHTPKKVKANKTKQTEIFAREPEDDDMPF